MFGVYPVIPRLHSNTSFAGHTPKPSTMSKFVNKTVTAAHSGRIYRSLLSSFTVTSLRLSCVEIIFLNFSGVGEQRSGDCRNVSVVFHFISISMVFTLRQHLIKFLNYKQFTQFVCNVCNAIVIVLYSMDLSSKIRNVRQIFTYLSLSLST